MTNARRIRALVVDDEPLAREMIREMLQDDSEVEIVSECANGREAVEAIKSLQPDLVFLDVQMPELGGFEVLESFDRGSTPYIIFVTAYDQYAVRAFEVHAFDYLLKPFDRERFDTAWQRVKQQIKLDQSGERDRHILALLEELKSGPRHLERLVIKNGGRVFFVSVNDVQCIESEGNYVRVYDNQKAYLLRETISSLELFFAVHVHGDSALLCSPVPTCPVRSGSIRSLNTVFHALVSHAVAAQGLDVRVVRRFDRVQLRTLVLHCAAHPGAGLHSRRPARL